MVQHRSAGPVRPAGYPKHLVAPGGTVRGGGLSDKMNALNKKIYFLSSNIFKN
jgi:hypothetical protein